jgi:rhamnosyl/mannosyltransferase
MPNPMAHFAYLVAKPRGKLVVTWHSDIVRQRSLLLLYRASLFQLLRRADQIIATSPAYLQHSPFLKAFYHKCCVIPLGIEYERFAHLNGLRPRVQELRQRYGDRVVLFVGRLTYYKGLDILLKAINQIDATLVIVGVGSMAQHVNHYIQTNGLRRRVHLVGQLGMQDLVAHYHACDAVVLPSVHRSEAFGLVQLEAMAAGRPVVSTNLTTGVPWVNQHGVTGLVVEPGKVQSLASALHKLLQSPELRAEFGANGRRRVISQFTVNSVVQRTMELYERLLGSRGGRSTKGPLLELW